MSQEKIWLVEDEEDILALIYYNLVKEGYAVRGFATGEEMLAALQSADERTGFFIRAHIGNYSLFLSGVFPERVRFRAEVRGFPGIEYYDALGRAHFRAASDHRLARRYELAEIFNTLSERFGTTRLALNDIADRLFSIGDANYSLEMLFNQDEKSEPPE